MRYEKNQNKILISVKEFVSLARRGISTTLPYDDEEPTIREAGLIAKGGLNGGGRVELEFSYGGIDYLLYGKAEDVKEDAITLLREVDGKPRRADISQARAEGFTLGYMLAKAKDIKSIELKLVYINTRDGDSEEKQETVTITSLERFFDKCRLAVSIYGRPEVERVTERLPSMKSAPFPYPAVREGQNEFIRGAYRALMRGTRLYATAPTGTGKTVSALFPALRTLGEGKCDKVFYLTPKTTTVKVAVDCLRDFEAKGVKLRAIAIGSKERSCRNGHKCRDDRRLCESSKSTRLADAVIELYKMEQAVITPAEVGRIAPKFNVCPYELGLAYSELCDIIICDFNYLFDPSVYIRRYFTEGGCFAFLVDEAHNLAERAREMYTAELKTDELTELAEMPCLQSCKIKYVVTRAREELVQLIYPYLQDEIRQDRDGKKIGATHLCEIPKGMYSIIEDLYIHAERELLASSIEHSRERHRVLKAFCQQLKKINNCLQVFDDKFRLILFLDGESIRLKWYCLDTGGVISACLDKGTSALLFSATLSPIGYYRDILGGDSTSEMLEVSSPFVPEQLSVSIMDRISLRYSERARTLPAVCAAVAATMIPRKGNYMVFSPSFEYSDALSEMFKKKYPKLRVLTQTDGMTKEERDGMIREFDENRDGYLVGFCVMGGAMSEGVDLVGKSLIGAVVIGIGMPALSYEREAMADYFQAKYDSGKEYAYIYPGMNRVLQAAGRVIRSEDDRGVIVLIDDRFDDPIYKKGIPALWRGMQFVEDHRSLKDRIVEFWAEIEKEELDK